MLRRLATRLPPTTAPTPHKTSTTTVRMASSKPPTTDYSSWSKEDLIARLQALELGSSSSSTAPPTPAGPSSPSAAASPAPVAGAATDKSKPMTLRKARAQPAIQRKQAPDLTHLPLRKVALKFSYLGAPYCGLAIQPDSPLPTVEGVMLKALEKSGLIDTDKGWEGCGFSRCGRTDRGVSAAGQVVSLWVRSRVEYDETVHAPRRPADGSLDGDSDGFYSPSPGASSRSASPVAAPSSDNEDDASLESLSSSAPFAQKAKPKPLEFPYISLLNRLLPPTIRLLAWAPLDPAWHKGAFDARHSCTHRHYKYFFTLASSPSPFAARDKPLDLEAMRKAASYLEGSHDYRNFCKVDGSKQIQSHVRQIDSATISAVPAVSSLPLELSPYSRIAPGNVEPAPNVVAPNPDVHDGSYYVLDLLGRAFLYHQVRHIMAVLFLVGSGLEQPEVVLDMFKWESKPAYEMASDQPLLLWDCGFPEGALHWQYGPLPSSSSVAAVGQPQRSQPGTHLQEDAQRTALMLNAALATEIQAAHLTTLLHAHFLSSFLSLHPDISTASPTPSPSRPTSPPPSASSSSKRKLYTFSAPLGANTFKTETIPAYVPLAKRKRGELPEVANRAWRVRMEGKGLKLKLVGGGKVVRMDAKDTLAGRVMHGVRWVEPDLEDE